MYRLNPGGLKPVHDWVGKFERLWTDHLMGIKDVAEGKARELAARDRAAAKGRTRNEEQGHDR